MNELEGDASVFLNLPMEAKGKTFVVTSEHVAGVQVALDWFQGIVGGYSLDDLVFYSERSVDLSDIEVGLFGTCDQFIYVRPLRKLYAADYKHGAGVIVDANDNWQAKGYAVGALKLFEGEQIDEVEIVIIQPRAAHTDGPIRSQHYHVFDILDFVGEARAMLAATRDPNAPRVPGEHCRFCRGANQMVCSEFKDGAVEAAKNEHDLIACPSTYDAEEFGRRLNQVSHIKMYLAKLDEFVNREALKGNLPKGYNWYWGTGRRKWADDASAERELIARIPGKDLYEPATLKSVAVIEKQLGKERFAENFAHLVETKKSPTLKFEASARGKPIPLDELYRASPDAFDVIATPQED